MMPENYTAMKKDRCMAVKYSSLFLYQRNTVNRQRKDKSCITPAAL